MIPRCKINTNVERRENAMTRHDVNQDIHGLEVALAQLEKRYGLLSADFYHFYKASELEQTRDFIQWVGYYEVKLACEAQYRGSHPPSDDR